MKILIASDKYKGTFSSKEIGEMIDKAIKAANPDIETEVLMVSDGGDGLIDSIRWRANYSRWEFLSYSANRDRKVQSKYLYNIYNSTAILESALTIGMARLRKDERDIMRLTSYGLGYDIARLLEVRRPKRVVIGVGGTATNDMFLGGASALGFRFLNADNQEIEPMPANFMSIERIVAPESQPWKNLEICVATDVTNPLCGPNGASAIYGPQKGASPDQVQYLDKALMHISEIIRRDFGVDVSEMPGSGAGGGIAGGIIALLGGRIIPGADFVLNTVEFEKLASDCDLVITGEGCLDSQSLQGKIVSKIIDRSAALGKPVAVVCGRCADLSPIKNCTIYPLFDDAIDLQEAKKRTPKRLEEVLDKIQMDFGKDF